jgi:hypothetical protein
VRKLLRSLATLLALRAANAALDAANAALSTAPGPDRGAPAFEAPSAAAIEEARSVVSPDEPSRGMTYGAGFEPGPVDDSFLPRPSLEGIEAECRYRMAAVAGMPEPRGFDTGKAKQRARDALDESLDLYNLVKDALD